MRKLDSISPLNTERKCEIGKVYIHKNDTERADRYFSAAIENARREALSHVDNVVTDIAETVAESAPALAEKYYVQLLMMKGDNLTEADMCWVKLTASRVLRARALVESCTRRSSPMKAAASG